MGAIQLFLCENVGAVVWYPLLYLLQIAWQGQCRQEEVLHLRDQPHLLSGCSRHCRLYPYSAEGIGQKGIISGPHLWFYHQQVGGLGRSLKPRKQEQKHRAALKNAR